MTSEDEGISTLVGTGGEVSEDPVLDATRAVAEHRAALASGDATIVERTLDLHTYGAGPRGLLSRLAGSESIPAAVHKLAPFFRKAKFTIEAARLLADDEVEIYEAMSHASLARPMRTVSLVRRRGGFWRVVTTADAPDEQIKVCLLLPAGPRDIPKGSLAGAASALEVEAEPLDGGALLVDELLGYQATVHVKDPFEAGIDATLPEVGDLVAASAAIAVVTMIPSTVSRERVHDLAWVGSAAACLAEAMKVERLLLPRCDRVLTAQELAEACQENADAKRLATAWVHFKVGEGWLGTRGMAHFMKPEIEVKLADFADPQAAARVVATTAGKVLTGGLDLAPGSSVEGDGGRYWVLLGRRGPVPGDTYGRWGAVTLMPRRK